METPSSYFDLFAADTTMNSTTSTIFPPETLAQFEILKETSYYLNLIGMCLCAFMILLNLCKAERLKRVPTRLTTLFTCLVLGFHANVILGIEQPFLTMIKTGVISEQCRVQAWLLQFCAVSMITLWLHITPIQ